jgi:hypothetical protein
VQVIGEDLAPDPGAVGDSGRSSIASTRYRREIDCWPSILPFESLFATLPVDSGAGLSIEILFGPSVYRRMGSHGAGFLAFLRCCFVTSRPRGRYLEVDR